MELVFVLVEVGPKIGVGDRLCGSAVDLWSKRDEARLGAVMLIAPNTPELSIGDVNSARDLVEQLSTRNLGPVILLQISEQSGLFRIRARKKALVLLHVELPLGLQLGSRLDPGWRRERSVLFDLVVRDHDAATLVLLLE